MRTPASAASRKCSREGPGTREERRDEALAYPVGQRERLLEALRALENEHGTERFLLDDLALVRGADDERGRVVGAGGSQLGREGENRRAAPRPRSTSGLARSTAAATRSRASSETSGPTSGRRLQRIAPRERFDGARQEAEELVEETRVQDRAPVGRAALPGEGEGPLAPPGRPRAAGPPPPRRSRRCCLRARPGAGSGAARRSPEPPNRRAEEPESETPSTARSLITAAAVR